MCLTDLSPAHKRQPVFFVYQTHVVVHADLMCFVLTVAVKGHWEDYGLPSTSNSCAR